MRLDNEKAHAVEGDLLRFQNGLCKPDQPRRDIQRLLMPLKLIVIVLPLSLDGEGERDKARLANILSKGFSARARPKRPFPSSNGWILSK